MSDPPTFPVLAELPSGYSVLPVKGGVAAVHRSVQPALAAVGWGGDGEPVLRPSSLAGRRPLFELELPGESLLVRRFTHGGLLRWATGERFLDPERPFREILLSDHLEARAIPTPPVVAARARRAVGGIGWNLEVVTRRIPGTADLGVQLTRIRAGELERARRASLLGALGRLVARMHAADFLHADLNPNNVLVELASLVAGRPRLWVLDLDRSRIGPVAAAEGQRNLGRLFRHVDRREAERGRALTRSDYLRVLRAYTPRGEDWKPAWRALEAQRDARRWHRLGWTLERWLGAGDPRA